MRLGVAALVLAGIGVAGCRSPFGVEPPTGPEAGKVGRGIHGWPLLEHAPHGPGWRTDVLWPVYSGIRTDGDGLNSTDVLLPLFLFEREGTRRRTGILRPLYDLETDGAEGDLANAVYDLDLLWPVFKWKDTPTVRERRLFPVWFEEEREKSGYTHVWPFWGREWLGTHEQEWVLTPFFSHTTDTEPDTSTWDAPWPLVHWGHEGTEEQLRVLPLFGHTVDEANDAESWDAIWPLLHHETKGDESTTWALPLYFHQASQSTETTAVLPVWWSHRSPTGTFGMLFPFYGRYEGEDGDSIVSVGGPLYVGGTSEGETFTWLLAPLVRWGSDEDGGASAHVFPVFWYARDADGDGYTHLWPLFGQSRHGDRTETSTLYPFFTYESRPDAWTLEAPWPFARFESRAKGGAARVWPLFDSEHSTDDDGVEHSEGNVLLFGANWDHTGPDERDFRILWKVVESTRHAGKDSFVVNPLFRHETNDAGDTYWSFLFGLIARKQEAGAVDWRFLWVL